MMNGRYLILYPSPDLGVEVSILRISEYIIFETRIFREMNKLQLGLKVQLFLKNNKSKHL